MLAAPFQDGCIAGHVLSITQKSIDLTTQRIFASMTFDIAVSVVFRRLPVRFAQTSHQLLGAQRGEIIRSACTNQRGSSKQLSDRVFENATWPHLGAHHATV
jgi:hypothetical protein